MNPPWWKTSVVYQIYPRSFNDTTGNGIGDLRGIAEKLDYLVWLGVDALWISPVFPSPMRDFGYDVSDYRGIDPLFGALEDFDALVAAAHERDIRIVLDVVPNHTSNEHPWFVEARGSRAAPRRDWYIWRDGKPDGSPPNNWRGVDDLGTPGSVWRFDDATGQYYLASFSPFQPDLNWANAEVRRAVADALRFWLERGVDGFRVDMIDFLGKDPELRDEPPATARADDYLVAARHQLSAPQTRRWIRDLRRAVHAYPDRVMIGEALHFLPPSRLARLHDDGIDLPFHFGLAFTPMEAGAVRARVDAYEAALGERWPNYNLANHDMPRIRRHGRAAPLAAVLLLTLRGTPFLYYGDELGMANVDVPSERRRDPFVIYQIGTTRDGVRTPMQWNDRAHAGFSEVEPWLPVAPDYRRVNVETERADATSLLWLHKRLLALRRSEAALRIGSYAALDDAPEGCFAFLRRHDDRRAVVALNFSGGGRRFRPPPGGTWRIALSTRPEREGPAADEIPLEPYEGVVLL